MSGAPLDGIGVLDFTSRPPGAFTTVMLAELSAEAVRGEALAKKCNASVVIGQCR